MHLTQKVLELCTEAKSVFIFISKPDEVDTTPIIKTLFSLGKQVVVPVVHGNEIVTVKLEAMDELVEGPFGILEPVRKEPVPLDAIDIFFVPGVLFDAQGNRKGRGKGYFDRFLPKVKGKKPVIGLCKPRQLKNHIKTNTWDVSVDKVLSG